MKEQALVTRLVNGGMVTVYQIPPKRINHRVYRYRVSACSANGEYQHVFCPTELLAESYFQSLGDELAVGCCAR